MNAGNEMNPAAQGMSGMSGMSGISGISGISGRDVNYATPTNAPPLSITRERFVEIVALASETVKWLEAKGLKPGEQCEFRQIAERLWFAPKG